MGNGSILDSDVVIKKETNDQMRLFSLLPPPERNHRPKRPSTWNEDKLESCMIFFILLLYVIYNCV